MVNTCGEIEHCTPCTEATPSREGVASLGGEWREAGEEGGRAASLPPSLPPWVVGELLGVDLSYSDGIFIILDWNLNHWCQ